jgi:MscS family membrane protein
MRVCLALVCLTICARGADPLGRESPQSAVVAFLQACHSKDFRRASRYLDLRNLPATARTQKGAQLAEQLGQVLDSDTRFDEASLSSQPDVAEPQTVASFQIDGKMQPLQMERVTLRPGVASWMFSPSSVGVIPRLAQVASDSTVEKYIPGPLENAKLLDTPVWRWIALVLAAVAAWAVGRIACLVVLLVIAPLWKRVTRAENLGEFVRPVRLIVGTAVFRGLMVWVGSSPVVRKYLEYVVSLLFLTGIAWLCMKALDLVMLYLLRTLQQGHRAFAHSVLPMAGRVSKVLISVLAGIAVLSSWGYNTTALLAGLGVGGVAVALAAQKTIENLFGGVAVITDRPVAVGDFCKFGDRSGTVEDIGLRSTRIRTPERTLVTVPNGAFSSMTLENLSRKDKTWFHLMLNLRRDTTPEQVRELLRTLTDIVNRTPKIEPGTYPVRFVGVGTYSLDLDIGAYFSTVDDNELAPIQEELYLAILDAVEAAGTSLAVPTQAYLALSQRAGQSDATSAHDGAPIVRR